MAINYSYSFNCTIKYRVNGETVETENPTFSDSTVLYTCTSTNSPDMIDEINLPLPNYLQGEEDQFQWYLSTDYTDDSKVNSGKIIKTTSWTLTATAELGTFVSYNAEITLYTNQSQKTITWKYKNEDASVGSFKTTTWQAIPETTAENYSSFIESLAPTIPSFATKKENETSTLYVFTGWKTLSGESPNYTAEASYSETTFNNTLPYTLKSNNPFADAEPYHYGEGTPKSGYYIPIGEDNDATTIEDIKVQSAEYNKYSNIKHLENFKINGHEISYLEVGTFPLLKTISSIDSAGEYDLVITYNTNKEITSITFADANCYNATNQNGPLYNDLKHGNEEFPKRLGFILVGGGGGSGGGGRYDPDKDEKNSAGDFIVPGGGGGGGEIVYGVLDISYEAAKKLLNVDEPNNLTYTIKIGSGGSAGAHKISEGASSGGHNGDPGNNGEDSVIYVSKAPKEEFVRACGGFGGGGATNFTLGTGGDGGSYSNSRNIASIASNYNCIIAGAIKGGKGGYPTSQTSVENENLAFSIYFSKTVPPTDPDYILSRKHTASSKTYSTDENTNAAVFQTPGGHSFGSGATLNANATMGGGGGCFESSSRNGANGYFGIYY